MAASAAALEAQFGQLRLGGSTGGGGFEEIEVINLTKRSSKDFIADANLMVIMRGVSGCGKSTIVKHLMSELDTKCVCSADHYFMKGGVYSFDRSQLKYAHEDCQQKAKHFCEQGHSVVIIDNTNIIGWETRHYVDLARTYGYIVVMITPNGHFTTSAETLAKRNKHGVSTDVIRKKLQDYSNMIPDYYAWFFSQRSTLTLYQQKEQAISMVKKHGQIACTYNKHNPIAHMTSIYVKRLKDPARIESVAAKLKQHFGEVESIEVTHIVLTPRTVSARVKFHKLARATYGNDGGDDNIHTGKPGFEKLAKGNAAHITLGTANGIKNYEARSDMILSHLCEVNEEPSQQLEGGSLVFYPEHKLAIMKLRDKTSFTAMFAGGYH